MTTTNPTPAPDMAVEARISELMELIDRHGALRWNTAWDERADRVKDAEDHDKAAVAVRAQIESALRAALARPQEVAGVTEATDAKRYRFWRDCWGREQFIPTLSRTVASLSKPLTKGDYNNFDIVSDAAIFERTDHENYAS